MKLLDFVLVSANGTGSYRKSDSAPLRFPTYRSDQAMRVTPTTNEQDKEVS